jgi:mono/diheme cytochrome c family protein
MRNVYLVTAFLVVLTVSVLGFRGTKFTHPPMDVFPEWAFPAMRRQPKPRPQGESKFFADGRADRPLPAGVVSRDPLRNDDALYAGKAADGTWLRGFPVPVDGKLMARGKERYTIYCSPCHGAVGDGNGITKQYGMGTTASYHIDRLRTMAEGELFNTITIGSPNKIMQSYADKLVPEDRWAVILYVRALQRAQMGTMADVPADHKAELGNP